VTKAFFKSKARATSVLAIFCQIANAKPEFAWVRANMSEVITKRQFARYRGSKGLVPWRVFFRTFFVARQRKYTKSRHSARAKLCARPGEKMQKTTYNPSLISANSSTTSRIAARPDT
jgi:hypothetical protein